MGLAVAIEARHAGDPILRSCFRYLALFGLLHGTVEWIDMAALLGQAIPEWLRAGLLVLSLLPLIQFGAQLLSAGDARHGWLRWSPLALLGMWVFGLAFVNVIVGVDDGSAAVNAEVWARYVLYLPGCVLAALALWRQSRVFQASDLPRIAGDARSPAAAFAFNALFAGVIVPEAPYPPASVLNYAAFTELVGVPPQVFRAAMAVLIAFWIVAFLVNSLVFLLIGFELRPDQFVGDLLSIAVVIVVLLTARTLIVYGLGALADWRGRNVSRNWRHVIFWGGLRGAVPVALALGLPIALPGRSKLVSIVFGVVLFSLLGQGLTMPRLLRRLGLTQSEPTLEQAHIPTPDQVEVRDED